MNTKPQKSMMYKLLMLVPNSLVKIANFTRHLILLLIFLLLLTWYLASSPSVTLSPNTALVIAPVGNIVNQYSGNPSEKFIKQIQGAQVPETQMRDLLKVVQAAANDKKITALVLKPDYIWNIGLADLKELEAAIDTFRRQSQKPVIALAENMTQNQYYFANLADEIILDPQAFMFFQGYGSFRNYFKDGLDKLGVDVHLFKVGEYKSAAEPYVRNDMSIDAKESTLHFMEDLWETYLTGITKHRDISVEKIKKIVEGQAELLTDSSGDIAKMYKEAGLVDQIKNHHFKGKYLADFSHAEDNEDGFRNIDYRDYLNLITNQANTEPSAKVAVIVAEGTILDGEQDAGLVGGVSTSTLLRQARLDKNVKAVVLRVNSPGGSVFASEQIRREVDAIKITGKPMIVSMGNVAASGGYWISMTADKIWANESTITGSIGIFGLFMTYPKTLEKIGVHTDGVGTSSWAGAFRVDKKIDEKLEKLIQSNIDHGYEQFITMVASSRNLDVEMVDTIARGRVWTAKQAKEFGLIDEIGGLTEAINDAATQAQIANNFQIDWIEPKLSGMEQLLLTTISGVSEKFNFNSKSQNQQLLEQIIAPFQEAALLLTSATNGRVTQYAHCFCEIK
jgi:protease-4